MYLVDTNTISHAVRSHPVVQRHFHRTAPSLIYLSAIVEAELRCGLLRKGLAESKLAICIEDLISNVNSVPWTSTTAKHFAKLRTQSERTGITLATVDLMIATQALEYHFTLVTNDSAMKRLKPWIQIADWTEETG